MAKPVIPTNFQDDVLSENMNDRRQYQMINNPNGTVSFIDVTQYEQIGDSFGQARVNNMATAINESVDKATVIDDVDDIVANTQPHMPAGALAVAQLYGEIEEGLTNIRWNPESNRIEVFYNGEWVNYPPSFVGDSIYLIQDGVCLVPYTITSGYYSVNEDTIFTVNKTSSGAVSSGNGIGLTFNKNILIDEEYEIVVESMHGELYASSTTFSVVLSGVTLPISISRNGFVTVRKTISSADGNIQIRNDNGTGANDASVAIKNLYLRRIREE